MGEVEWENFVAKSWENPLQIWAWGAHVWRRWAEEDEDQREEERERGYRVLGGHDGKEGKKGLAKLQECPSSIFFGPKLINKRYY